MSRRRISPHGRRVAAGLSRFGNRRREALSQLPFPARTLCPRFIYRCPNCRQRFSSSAPRSNAQSPVSPVAAHTTAASSILVFAATFERVIVAAFASNAEPHAPATASAVIILLGLWRSYPPHNFASSACRAKSRHLSIFPIRDN